MAQDRSGNLHARTTGESTPAINVWVQKAFQPILGRDLQELDQVLDILFVIDTPVRVRLSIVSKRRGEPAYKDAHQHEQKRAYGPECSNASQGTNTRKHWHPHLANRSK